MSHHPSTPRHAGLGGVGVRAACGIAGRAARRGGPSVDPRFIALQ